MFKNRYYKILAVIAGLVVLAGCQQPIAAEPSQSPTPAATSPSPEIQEDDGLVALNTAELQLIEQFERLSPSVVYVTNLGIRRVGFSRDVTSIPQGTGSGFVWDKNGTIVTNFHVIKGAQNVEVTLSDGSVWEAKPVGFEPEKDLAVMDIDAPADKLFPIPIGRSSTLKVGQSVLAIGNPFGLDHTLTTGVISGLDREIRSPAKRPIQGVIQTDAAINPGNSGGPLLDSGGRLIGMNTAIYSPSGAYAGIGFAVPVDTIGRMIPELLKYGKVTKPGLGVTIASTAVTRRLNIDGVLVLNVIENGPAAKVGLRPTTRNANGHVMWGDILIRIDDKQLSNIDDLYRYLDLKKVGDTVKVEYLRDNQVFQTEITLARVN